MSQNKMVGTESRQYKIPDFLSETIELRLRLLGHSLYKPGALSVAVKKLSDYYIENPTKSTPWHQSWAQAAYLAYFFPLNYLRMWAVFDELKRVGFLAGLDKFIDFGCGISAVPFMAKDTSLKQGIGIDLSPEALELTEKISAPTGVSMRTYQKFNGVIDEKRQMGVLSYVITETQKLPAWAVELEALLIIEPSTREDGRYLLDLREALLEDGYHAWAPCTHQKPCPLFNKSKKDWCHDRILVEAPDWYHALEKLLPMKNKSITYSYLAVRRTPPRSLSGFGRSVGDLLDENGKYRELICRSEEREYLAWLKKEHSEAPALMRGHLFELPTLPDKKLEKKSDELRVPADLEILPAGQAWPKV